MKTSKSKLTQHLKSLAAEKKWGGISFAVYGPKGLEYAGGIGHRDCERKQKIDENTVVGIASMSKSMTTLALCLLQVDGKLCLDDPVAKYFPKFRVPGQPKETVTLRHLAMHTAGIPPIEPLEWSLAMADKGREEKWIVEARKTAPNKMNKVEQIIEYIGKMPYEPLGAPGEYMSYSNDGYAILSSVVDIAASMPLEQFLQERVFGPIGMTRSILDEDATEARKMADGNITSLFEVDPKTKELVCDDFWSIAPPYRGCGWVKSTALDVARYYHCLSNYGVIDGRQALPVAAVELMLGEGFPVQEKAYYMLGLNKRLFEGHVICEHSGGLHGVSTQGGLLLEEGYGVAALCNTGDQDIDESYWALYNAILGLPLDTDHNWLHLADEPFSEPKMLTGDYANHEGAVMILKVRKGKDGLTAKAKGLTLRLEYCGENWFLGYIKDQKKPARRLQFYIRNGHAWAVKVGSRIFQRVPAAN